MLVHTIMHHIAGKQFRFAFITLTTLLIIAVLARFGSFVWVTSSPLLASGAAVSHAGQHSLQTILNSTLGFERILAINLPERTDHHDGLVLAATVTDLLIEFVEGVHGDTVLDKVLPAKHANDLSTSVKGSWRAHMNAISRVVEHGWESALIIEDDVDWDIRLKQQLQEFAIASNHLSSTNSHDGTVKFKDISRLSVFHASPYGRDWDVLWLGHCGMDLPSGSDATIVLREEDETVPEVRYHKSWDEHASNPLANYPQHSRTFAEQCQGTCSLAYAVSQSGSRKLLRSLGLKRFDMPFDLMLREWCQEAGHHEKHRCFSVLPQLFDHHRRIGPNEIDSDISTPNGKYREEAYTYNIRWSVRLNMDKLLKGETSYDDQWPDT